MRNRVGPRLRGTSRCGCDPFRELRLPEILLNPSLRGRFVHHLGRRRHSRAINLLYPGCFSLPLVPVYLFYLSIYDAVSLRFFLRPSFLSFLGFCAVPPPPP